MTETVTSQTPVAVLKVGGDVIADATQRAGLVENIRLLGNNGYDVVVVHGGGPQTTALQNALGREPTMVAGRRVTSPRDLVAVTQAIAGEANVQLVASLQSGGLQAFGCHGASGGLVRASRRPPVVVEGGGSQEIDFGEVGDVTSVNASLLRSLLDLGLIPVIATLGLGTDGTVYNINADTTVIQIALALRAEVLILVTSVGGVFTNINDPATRLPALVSSEATQLIEAGVIQGGMVPKIVEAFRSLDGGVGLVAIVDAGTPDSFARVATGDRSVGTVLLRS